MELIRAVPWQVWVLLSGVLTGLAQSVGKQQIHQVSALQMGVLRDVTGWVLAFFIWRYLGTAWPAFAGRDGWYMLIAMANGALVAVGVALYFIATRTNFSGSSVFGYLLSQIMIVVSSAVLFAEWVYFDPSTGVGRGNLAALGLTIAAMLVYVNSLKLGRKWVGLLILSSIINVVGNLVAKYLVAGQMNVWNYFYAEQMGLAAGGIGILLWRRQGMAVGKKNFWLGVSQGVLAIMGPMIYLNVLVSAPLSLASLVRRIAAIMVAVVYGLWWYREREGMGKRAGISLAVGIAAFVLILIVNR